MLNGINGVKFQNRDGQLNRFACALPKAKENLDVSRFLGVWYEILSYPFTLTQDAKCVVSTFALGVDLNLTIYTKFINSRGMETKFISQAEEQVQGALKTRFAAARKQFLKFRV